MSTTTATTTYRSTEKPAFDSQRSQKLATSGYSTYTPVQGNAAKTTTAVPQSSWKLDEDGKFSLFPWDTSSLLIPSFVGKATISVALQREMKIKYFTAAALGLGLFYLSPSAAVRTAGLSVLFPGAGFLAVGGISGAVGLCISLGLLPLCLFAWFAAGGLAFPLGDWIISGLIATYAVRDEVVESSAVAAVGLLGIAWTYLKTRTDYEEEAEISKRDRRNRYLQQADNDWQNQSTAAGPPGSRELTLTQLRFAQRIVDLALKDFDDWSGHTDIDQFQTSALRYQLYEFVYTLATWNSAFAPSFRGYLAAAMRNAIDKSCTKRVVNYWKWESLWGHFTTNWDPIEKDNIMITGYMVLACGVYQSVTGDARYEKEGSLEFVVDSRNRYKYSIHSMYQALVNNWQQHRMTLYPCEPNWVYSMCNLEGMSGAVVYDRLNKTTDATRILKKFYPRFEENFFTKGGSCIPIRSGITGFTIPGLCGIVGDTSNAIYCSPTMPTLAKRMWLIAREDNLRWNADGKIEVTGLKGADQIDVGSYKPGKHGAYAMFSLAAAEWGDRKIADACLDRVEELCEVKTDMYTGAKWYSGLSTLATGWLARSHMGSGGDWANTVGVGVEEKCRNGPLVDHVPYPEVLVAKAYSPTGKDLDLVFYPGRNAGRFEMKLSQLQAGMQYVGQDGVTFTADADGKASIAVNIDGRTAITIRPA